ncbi:MAG: GntR family transcriptional regulator [Verrucomicrobiota bacterium JB024]|nr:GntR family transcriptional regulator [Verrucomicrobiota bacterium JB024]
MSKESSMARRAAYEKVRDEIVSMIREGLLRPGDRLPSEKELAQRFRLNHQTVRRGLADLADLRVIERRVGSGSFVRLGGDDLDQALASQMDKDHVAESTVPMLGVLCLTDYDAFATKLLNRLHHLAAGHGLQIMIRVVSDFGDEAVATVQQMIAHGCRAIIVPWARQGEFTETLWNLKRTVSVPVVSPDLHEKDAPGKEAGWIDLVRIEIAFRYFQELGHRRIAFFGPYEPGNLTVSRRLFAYTRLANESGLATRVRLVKASSAEVLEGLDEWAPLCVSSEQERGLAVICYDDDCALRLITSAHKRGLDLPRDLALIGFNNVALGQVSDPPLTTIEFGYDRLAERLVEQAVAAIDKRQVTHNPVFRERMIVRESCGGRASLGEVAQQMADRLALEVAGKHGVAPATGV